MQWAILLACLDIRILINYKSGHQAAKGVITEIQAIGDLAYALPCDISSEEEVVRLFEVIKEQYSDLHYLVNNAGISALLNRGFNRTAD